MLGFLGFLGSCVFFIFVFRVLLQKLKGVDEEKPTSDNDAPDNETSECGVEEESMSDNNTSKIKYDVFVSFRGEIRDGFLSHLIEAFKRNNINVFVDDRLKKGEEIGSALVGAIKGSSISLIIFSPDYASSRWCLDELATIIQCKEKYQQFVIPVFYKVEPTEVRHQSSKIYQAAFAEHEKKYNNENKVKIWRDALKKSADIAGIASSKYPNEADMVKAIVDLVLPKLVKPLVNSKGLVGIDENIAKVESWIHKDPKDNHFIGIWGMGGIGKTTLAQEIFNKLRSEYEGSCFLLNEREESRRVGINSLKEEIFSKLLGNGVKTNTPNSLPDDRIRQMKVLIVLDDVNDSDHIEQLLGTLDNFGSGSRIIVTTRNVQVLNANNIDMICELRELSYDKALELFNMNAFNESDHKTEYHELSKGMVEYAKSIPLVLKVLGRHLRGKNKEVWESCLDKLKKEPLKKVFDVLKLSYVDLDRKEKQIFLDLACFFVRLGTKVNIDHLKSLLKDDESDDSVIDGLERLKDKALITFSKDNYVSMHDKLQEMAWEIVRRESSKRGYLSHLWDLNDIEALQNYKGIEAVRSVQINLSTIKKLKLSPQILFGTMRKLMFVEISGNYDHNLFAEGLQFLASELKFLVWKFYPLKSLPENLSTERLVILSLRESKVEKLWDGAKDLLNLGVLILRDCHFLKELPSSFGHQSKLKLLDLSWCWELQTVPELPLLLQTLNVFNSKSLQSLPKLPSSLETLSVYGCRSLQTLPELSSNLTSLDVSSCTSLQTLSKLPSNLTHLRASSCTSLQTLPELPSNLTDLDVSSCTSLQTLPELPSNLTYLYASSCTSLQTLPELPSNLTYLRASSCTSLQTLPELPSNLTCLDVSSCTSLQTLPELPSNLPGLDVSSCTSLQTLPELPSNLKYLYASSCTSLQTLPELPSNLIGLHVSSCTSLQTLPELPSNLPGLNVLSCTSLQTLPELPSNLTYLYASSCTSLQILPELPSNLRHLYASYCTSLQTLPELPSNLTGLDVSSCTSLQTLSEFPSNLTYLRASSCTSLQTLPKLPSNLTSLDVSSCTSIQTLPEFPSNLSGLDVSSCTSLQTLPELPSNLTDLDVSSCTSLQTLPKLPSYLTYLDASSCTSLQTLPELPSYLIYLRASSCTSLQTLAELPSYLIDLDVSSCTSLQTLPELPSNLTHLYASSCTSLQTLPNLPSNFKDVDVSSCTSL